MATVVLPAQFGLPPSFPSLPPSCLALFLSPSFIDAEHSDSVRGRTPNERGPCVTVYVIIGLFALPAQISSLTLQTKAAYVHQYW